MISEFFQKIKDIIRPVKKIYVVKTTPEVLRLVEPYLKKELGMKESIIVKQQQEIEKLKKALAKKEKPEKEQEKILEELMKKKIAIEKMKEGKRVRVLLQGKLPLIRTWDKSFFVADGKPLKFLKGWEYEKGEKGITVNLLLVSDPKEKTFYRKKTGLPWELIWEDPIDLISDIKTGAVRVRIDTKDTFYPPTEDLKTKKEYEKRIAELEEKISTLYSELENAKKREESMIYRIKDLEMSNSLNDYRAEVYQSALIQTLSKIKPIIRENMELLLSAQESEVNRVLTERLNEILVDAFKEVRERVGRELPIEVQEVIRDKVRAELIDTLDILHELSPRKIEVMKEEKPKEKKEEKKGEEK
jgi:hypothetical protein